METVTVINYKRTPFQKNIPLLLALFVFLADQISKLIILKNIPEPGTLGADFGKGFLWIIHERNNAIAFSLGADLPEIIRILLFSIIPLGLLTVLINYLVKSDTFSSPQRWALSAIIGGGLGNIFDRIFRPKGVIDFISVKFYGIFKLERWPTFNIADACVVIAAIILIIMLITESVKTIKRKKLYEQES